MTKTAKLPVKATESLNPKPIRAAKESTPAPKIGNRNPITNKIGRMKDLVGGAFNDDKAAIIDAVPEGETEAQVEAREALEESLKSATAQSQFLSQPLVRKAAPTPKKPVVQAGKVSFAELMAKNIKPEVTTGVNPELLKFLKK